MTMPSMRVHPLNLPEILALVGQNLQFCDIAMDDDYYHGGHLETKHTDNDEDADDSLDQQEYIDQSALPMTLNQYADFVRQLTFYGTLPIHANQTFPDLKVLTIHFSFSASSVRFENDRRSKFLLLHISITHLVLNNTYISRSIQFWHLPDQKDDPKQSCVHVLCLVFFSGNWTMATNMIQQQPLQGTSPPSPSWVCQSLETLKLYFDIRDMSSQ
ncbi:hypothetical protein BGZ51_006051 [Haplosporangium sp. Z 767]|nr:hypothetical protein BGZ51_006051 [Haplosporangium sp. Z 767]